MRIIGGISRGRLLKMPRVQGLRPTKDNIRQVLFDVLGNVPEGARVLDLFSGSGALGLEAVSRGAAEAVFVEKDARCAAVIKENLQAVFPEAGGRARVVRKDALRYLEDPQADRPFDLILLDPPYLTGLGAKALKLLDEHVIVNARCVVVWEHHKKDDLPEGLKRLKSFQRKQHGDTVLSFYRSLPAE